MKANTAVEMLSGLAQETRLRIFRLLVQAGPNGVCAGDVAKALRIAPATLSFHLTHLRHARLVKVRRSGRMIFYSADYKAMNALLTYLTENCCGGAETCDEPGASTRLQEKPRDETSSRTRRRARSG